MTERVPVYSGEADFLSCIRCNTCRIHTSATKKMSSWKGTIIKDLGHSAYTYKASKQKT